MKDVMEEVVVMKEEVVMEEEVMEEEEGVMEEEEVVLTSQRCPPLQMVAVHVSSGSSRGPWGSCSTAPSPTA